MAEAESHRRGPTTERLELRAFEPEDAEAFYALKSHPDVIRYTAEDPIPSVEAAREAIEAYPDWDRYGFGRWACILRSTREVIGFCGFKRLPELDDEVDLGYRFLPQHWGKGLATEAGSACLNYGVGVLGLSRIIGLVLPENRASLRVLDKLSFIPDGEVLYFGTTCVRYLYRPAPT